VTDDRSAEDGQHEFDIALRLLSGGVPLSLLLDLAAPPHSTDIYNEEAGDTDWLIGAHS
jgi:hypothetical protein